MSEAATDLLILVDENDQPKGTAPKLLAHQKGWLHRAVSVLLFDAEGNWLLQQRELDKYHCGGLWTNTCCTHPFVGEANQTTAVRRLQEEMGIEASPTKAFEFLYRAEFPNGLVEYEYDHVFIGEFSGEPQPNPAEVMDWAYRSTHEIERSIRQAPQNFTPWFRILFEKIREERHVA